MTTNTRVEGVRSDDTQPVLGYLLLVSTVACTAGWIITSSSGPFWVRVSFAVASFAAFGALFIPKLRDSVFTRTRVSIAVAALLVVAVAIPPRSHDMWAYVMYGRIVTEHNASPYTHVSADYPNDPLESRAGWPHTPAVYGPVFVGVAAAITLVTDESALASRLAFQGMEVLALAAALVLLWRRTRDPVALAFIGLNPALLLAAADGHNDVLVGLAVLAAVLLISDRRPVWAGTVLATAAMIKIIAVVPLAALVLWAWRHFGRRTALSAAGTAGALMAAGYALVGGWTALDPVVQASRARTSRTSIWRPLVTALQHHYAHAGNSPRVAGNLAAHEAGSFAIVSIIVLLAVVLWFSSRTNPPAWVAGAAVLAFVLPAQYVLPWYVAWGLPALGLVWRSRLAVLAAVHAALLAISYVGTNGANPVFEFYYGTVVPVGYVIGIVLLVVLSVREHYSERSSVSSKPDAAASATASAAALS
ncbi:MAG: hypothetical protein JWL83_4178 [Actinomycetia bacterium]|nr:hypothetical protein [Actinomycetes bacterium]